MGFTSWMMGTTRSTCSTESTNLTCWTRRRSWNHGMRTDAGNDAGGPLPSKQFVRRFSRFGHPRLWFVARTMNMEKILVIEDDRAVQRALKRLFESEGYGVHSSFDGSSGLEA